MNHPARNRHEGHRHHGNWVLIDADLQHLWMLGTNQYPARSARSVLDTVARRGLFPALRTAVETRRPVDRVVRLQRSAWRFCAIPLLGVVSDTPIAVLGIYDAPTAELPPPPPVGTWEMHSTPPGPGQELHSNVSPAMYEAYGVPVNDLRIDTSQWKDDLVALVDRPRSRAFFTTLLTDQPPTLKFFDFTTCPPNNIDKRYALRCTGRRYEQDGDVWQRGLTFRLTPDPIPAEPAHLEAVLALSRDPIWLVDPRYEVIYLSTDNLATYGLRRASRVLADLCHPEDLSALRAQLRWASEHLGQPTEPVQVRFAVTTGGWQLLEVCGTGVRIADGVADVWCRVAPPGGDAARIARA